MYVYVNIAELSVLHITSAKLIIPIAQLEKRGARTKILSRRHVVLTNRIVSFLMLHILYLYLYASVMV